MQKMLKKLLEKYSIKISKQTFNHKELQHLNTEAFFIHMKLLLFFITLIGFNIGYAQTEVSGTVVDENNEGLPFANIVFKNSRVGVSTDIDGHFQLKSDKNFDQIEVSFVGYTTKIIALKSNLVKGLTIRLSKGQELREVVVVSRPKKHLSKKENPAYRILKGIWAHKKKNGLQLVKAYDYKRYTSVSVGLSNLDSIFLKKTMGSNYDSIARIIRSGKKDKRFFVPIYMKEIYESIYGNNEIKKERVDIEAERNVGVGQQGFIFDRISNTFTDINIYDDDIIILNKPFVSPISTRGYGVYDYVLKDSIVENNKKTYHIYFFPRNTGTIAFEGSFKVIDNQFAITEISMKVNRRINLNLVRDLSIEKSFEVANDSVYLPARDFYEGDFTLLTKNDQEKGLFVRKNIVFSEYDLDPKHDGSFYNQVIEQTRSDQFLKEDSYWNNVTTKDPNLKATRQIINELKEIPRVKNVSNVINILATGYIPVYKNIQFGSIWQGISNNDIEGIRCQAGLRSFKTPNDLFRAQLYVVYGTRDNLFKYGGEVKYLFSAKPRMILGITHLNDNLQLGGLSMDVSDLISNVNSSNLIINRGSNYFLSRVVKNSIYFDWAIHNNLHFTLTNVHQRIRTASEEFFPLDYTFDGTNIQKEVTSVATNIAITYTPNRFVYGFGVDQRFGRTLYPTITLKYTHGYKNLLGGDFNYNKVQAGVSRPIFLSNLGILRTYIEAGKTFETLPLPLLNPIAGNQAYSIMSNTFCLLDYYDLVTDTYIMGHFNHHFNGLILNRIPLIKKLKLREIAFFRTVYGTIRNENIAINKSNITYNAPSERFYSEFGFGIDNIGYGNFRPLRVDFVWRSNFNDVNGSEAPHFGLRLGFNPEF
ncbi:MAG: hypothetical protein CFE24_05550 [Flavobacterium sp. BFFFF2]|nr:MAG: hypothetical protein CFE24_05550 [Flavobacterium sp. BFFFF2]